MWYASIATETLKLLNLKDINTQYRHNVSHGTRQVDNPISAILSPVSLPLCLLLLWWSIALIPEDHVAEVVSFMHPQGKKFHGVRSGNLGGQSREGHHL
jgi:hypothetical protein